MKSITVVAHGGRMGAVIPVRRGETLYVFIGGAGTYYAGGVGFHGTSSGAYADWNGGECCGGDAPDIRQGDDLLSDCVVIAGALRACCHLRPSNLVNAEMIQRASESPVRRASPEVTA